MINVLCHHNPYHDQRTGKFTSKNGGEQIFSRDAKKANDIFKTLGKKDRYLVTAEHNARRYTTQKEYTGKKSLNVYSIISQYGNTPVSVLDIWALPGDTKGDISIMTRSGTEYRKKGHASRAVQRGIDWFNKQDNLDTLYWNVNNSNTASINLAQKYGFIFEDGDDEWSTYTKKK